MSDTEHPISAHVDEYVKMLQWSDTAMQDVKTIVIGNLRGFAAYLAAIESQADILAHTRKGDGPTLTNEQVDAFLTQHKDDPVDTAQLERVRARFNEKLAAPSTSEAIRGAAEEIARLPTSNAYATDEVYRRVIEQVINKHFCSPVSTAGGDEDQYGTVGDGRYCRHHDDDPAHGAICYDKTVYEDTK